MYTRRSGLAIAAGMLLAPFVVPARALFEQAPRPDPLAGISAVQAAEMEAAARATPPRAVDMPVLIYHHVAPEPPPGYELMRALFETPDDFERELKYLKDNGYQAVSFNDLADFLQFGLPLPGRPVILSFDDGWQNQFDYAFPLLKKYDFTATFFVATGYLEHPNFMTIQQLQTLMGAGMTIGSHTCSHVALATIDSPSKLQEELAGSKAWLEKRLSVPINNFAYPYGSYSVAVASAVEATGYRTARTFDNGAHYTRSRLATLPGTLFETYTERYRYVVELAAATPR